MILPVPRFLLAALLLLGAGSPAGPARAAGNDDCLACHGDPSLTAERNGKPVSLHTDPAKFAQSVHRDLACTDCHAGFDPNNLPHRAKIAPVNCRDCHGDAAEKHPFHPRLAGTAGADGGPGTSCKGCHGTHEVKSPRGGDSPFAPARLVESCGACHREVTAPFAASAHGTALAAAVKGAPDCLSCHRKPLTRARWEGNEAEAKLAQEKVCLSCHLDNADVRARMAPGAGFIAAYEHSVHGAALLQGNGKAANCVDCHGSHEMSHGADPAARVSKAHIPETCARCHAEAAAEYRQSAHAAAVKRGNSQAPVCTDCHGEHDILKHTDPASPVAAANVSARVCSPCHSSLKLSEKYGLASDRFRTFNDSYHGLALRGGELQVANCASCHGAHAIKPSADPTSTINKANLAATCGKCHPGANARFAIGSVHVITSQPEHPALYWVATAYVGLIVLTISGMVLHNLLDFVRRSRRRLRIRRGLEPAEEYGRTTYLRMTGWERIQHATLLTSFFTLVLTGFMLRYPDAWWVAAMRRLSSHAFEYRSVIHRIAGVTMVLAGLAHLHYLALTRRGREFLRDIFPVPGDATEAIRMIGYNLGLTRRHPQFGRFSYIEKSEYWAVVWGTIIMGATGVVLWFENTFIRLFTKLGYDVARTIHFYEAWLAFLAILVWHLYWVLLNPDTYPMNSAWITGSLSEEEMAAEHPRELAEIRRRQAEAEQAERAAGAGTEEDPTPRAG